MEANLVLSKTLEKSARLSSLDSVANIYQDSHFYVFLKGGGGGGSRAPQDPPLLRSCIQVFVIPLLLKETIRKYF